MPRSAPFRCPRAARHWLAAACLLMAPLADAGPLPVPAPPRIDIGVLAVLVGE